MNNMFMLNSSTLLYLTPEISYSVQNAVKIFNRDIEKVIGTQISVTKDENSATIIVKYADASDLISRKPEAFTIRFCESKDSNNLIMYLIGSDDLGVIYSLLHISKEYLGIDPFWFWRDFQPERKTYINIPIIDYFSTEAKVKYRGWFVNDEVCLLGWTDIYPPPKEVWAIVFETLLRCGGNMVIPGTDLPREGKHFEIASEMGLYITHHHAEPLGAEMFLRAYPKEKASYVKNSHLFEKLWREAIEKNKNKKIIWILGFRGQGDSPFWENDPSFTSSESRGKIIRLVIDRQYEILLEYVKNPVCAVYLYGEITELYKEGYLSFPNGVIKIWSDNGYGKMVTRRRDLHNPRTPSLPYTTDKGPHGLYYHITYHDLQASSHLTMLGNSMELVNEELAEAFSAGVDEFLLLNCGNIRPHVYPLDTVSQIWSGEKINVENHLNELTKLYFPSAPAEIKYCYKKYFDTCIKYGAHLDDKAGDEFYHHPAREIITHWIKGLDKYCLKSLIWATDEIPFKEQVKWFKNICTDGFKQWDLLKKESETAALLLTEKDKIFFEDNLLLQITLHYSGCNGFLSLCSSYEAFLENNYPLAFVYASIAMKNYKEGVVSMQKAEHGKWNNFYRADWLTNVNCTINSLDSLRKYLRILGDAPSFFSWYKNLIIPETERQIYLENTQRRTLSDDELTECLIQKVFMELK